MRQSESIAALAADLAKAQAVIKNATENKQGNRNRYASLAQVRNQTMPILSEHGFTMVQGTSWDPVNKFFILITRLLHKSGEWLESTYPLHYDPNSQLVGSAMTYGRRYCWTAMLGIDDEAEHDDDGQMTADASKKNGSKPIELPPSTPTQASAYHGTKLIHPDTPKGKNGSGPSAYSAKGAISELIADMQAIHDLDKLDIWWDASGTQAFRSRLPFNTQIMLFEEYMEHAMRIAATVQEMTAFWKAKQDLIADMKTIDPTRYQALCDVKEQAKSRFAMEAG